MSSENLNNTLHQKNDADTNIQWSKIFPQRLSNNYRQVFNLLKPLKNKSQDVDVQDIATKLQEILNDSMPQNEYEHNQRIQEFLHFYKDPEGYYQHLLNSKLRFLVFWTDYKYITNHFKIRNIIHIRWNGANYECQVFDKTKRIKAMSKVSNEKVNASA